MLLFALSDRDDLPDYIRAKYIPVVDYDYSSLALGTLGLKKERKKSNQCLGGLRTENQGEQNPQTFLVKTFSSCHRHENMKIGALSSKF